MGLIPAWAGSSNCNQGIVYPHIMQVVDALFLSIYFLTIILHCNNYFKKWNIKDDKDCPTIEEFTKNRVQKKLKAQFEMQTSRFLCWYTFLITLNFIKLITN